MSLGYDASNREGLVFSIFLCGCKQPKSIHILKNGAKISFFFVFAQENTSFFYL